MELNVTLFPLAFMAMQISVEYENGGFLSPFFLYCSALSKPGTRKHRYYSDQSPADTFWRQLKTQEYCQNDITVSTHSSGNVFCAEVFSGSDRPNGPARWANQEAWAETAPTVCSSSCAASSGWSGPCPVPRNLPALEA